MNELSNKAENEKIYFENHLSSASQVIGDLEQRVLQLSNINEKAKLAVDDYKMEADRLRNELEMWRGKFEMLESRYQREMQSKSIIFEREVVDVIEKFNSEKDQYENLIRSLVSEIDNMKGDPNYSYKITLIVRELESRIGRLMDVNESLRRAVKQQGSIEPMMSKTPERFKRSPKEEGSQGGDEKLTVVKSFTSSERFGVARRSNLNSSLGSNGNGKFTSYK